MNDRPSSPPKGSAAAARSATSSDETRSRSGVAHFFTGTGFPLFLLAAAVVYEAFLLAVVLAPQSTSAWGGFALEFKQWCFRYDARTGGMEWAAVWVMLVEPAFVVGVAAFLWRNALRPLRRAPAWRRHYRAVLAGAAAAGLAMAALFVYGRPAAGADDLLPFPGERIRTRLVPPAFTFTDQKSQPVSFADLRGRVVLVTGIYAMCSLACPEILVETKQLLDSLPPHVRAQVTVLALSLNPEEDTLDLMGRITAGYGFTYPEFRYANGEPAGMHETLTALGFARVKNPQTGVIDHANLFLLVDQQGAIAYRFTLDLRHRPWLREALTALATESTGP